MKNFLIDEFITDLAFIDYVIKYTLIINKIVEFIKDKINKLKYPV